MNDVPTDSRFPFARISNLALLAAAAFAFLALRRFATFHNETFDLAFYARMVWGLGRGDLYHPITNSYFWGLHASPILFPLGLFARWFRLPVVPLLLVLQAAAVAAAGIPLARLAARRTGHPLAADVTLWAYLLYPTISTVATYEFHPSALALFPLALSLDFFDRASIRRGLFSLAVAVSCREDVALIAALAGLALALQREHRKIGLTVFAVGVVYFTLYFFVIAPKYLPRYGSLDLHFGYLGGSPSAVARTLFFHPMDTLRAVITPAKILYIPRSLLPVAFLSLLSPRWLLPALVPWAINFLSAFPTAVQIQSHYSVLAVPFLFVSAVHGAAGLATSARRSPERYLVLAGFAVALGTLHMHRRAGATPLSRRWNTAVFRRDSRSDDLRVLLPLVPASASIAAPDYVLPHVAERNLFDRVPWRRGYQYVLLSTEYRSRFGFTQELWRSTEEALVRNTLAGRRYGLYAVSGRHLLFRRNWPVRWYARGRYVEFQPREGVVSHHLDVGPSLAIAGYGLRPTPGGSTVTLLLVARRRWPHDLGLELGWGPMHPHGDRLDPAHIVAALPFDGLFSPVHVRVGEVVCTEIPLPVPTDALRTTEVYFGARRIDGSRLDPESRHWTLLSALSGTQTPSGRPAREQ